MEICLNSFDSTDRYDDGVTVDYAFMIRMWSALDRSITRFNRECGVILPRAKENLKSREGRRKNSGK